jgi:formate-nitrite transporter family protein
MLIPAVNKQDHILGVPETRRVVLVEYGSYDCPECYSAYFIVKDIQRYLGNHLAYVFRQFPSCDERSVSFRAAEAAEAASSQGWFWEMHDLLFEHQFQLDERHLEFYAAALPLDADRFRRELKSRTYAGRVRESLKSGVLSGVRGGPTFFINGRRYDGRPELDELLCRIEDIGCFSDKN